MPGPVPAPRKMHAVAYVSPIPGGGSFLHTACVARSSMPEGGGGRPVPPTSRTGRAARPLLLCALSALILFPSPPPRSGRLVLVGGEQPSSLLVFPVTHLAPFPCR